VQCTSVKLSSRLAKFTLSAVKGLARRILFEQSAEGAKSRTETEIIIANFALLQCMNVKLRGSVLLDE